MKPGVEQALTLDRPNLGQRWTVSQRRVSDGAAIWNPDYE
jgi:hypothetical protein